MNKDNKNKIKECTQSKGVQSLVRGLNVLVAVNEHTPATVTKVVASTGLPKATVIRLLQTLKGEGYIDMDRAEGGYKPLPKVRLLASPMLTDNSFALTARHYLNDFSQQIKWPTDLLMPEGASMVVQASNRDTAPIQIKRFEQARFALLSSASGIAYLSAESVKKRQEMINAIASLQKSGTEATAIAAQTYQKIEDAVKRGYAIADYHAPIEGTRAIAIPLTVKDKPFGALAMLFIKDAVTKQQLNDFLLPSLKEAAQDLAKLYAQNQTAINLAPIATDLRSI